VIFGMAFGGEIENVPIVIINKDSEALVIIPPLTVLEVPSIGEEVLENLERSSKVDVNPINDGFEVAKELVKDKEYIAAILIPENFTFNLVSPFGENISIELYLDNSNPQVGLTVLQALQEAFQDAVSFILILMNLIEERKKGTLPLVLQCPFDKGQIIMGYLGAFSILSLIQTTLVIVTANLVYQVSFGTNIWHYISLYITAVLLGWTSLVLGIFCSSFARSEFQAVQFIPLVLFPAIFLSGIIIPLIQIPEIFRWLSLIFPLTYGVHLLQRIAIEGYILEPLNLDLIAMFLFFILFLFGSRLTLKET